jgi:MFS family permease
MSISQCAQDQAVLADLGGALPERLGRHRRLGMASPMLQEIFAGKLIGKPDVAFSRARRRAQKTPIATIAAGFAACSRCSTSAAASSGPRCRTSSAARTPMRPSSDSASCSTPGRPGLRQHRQQGAVRAGFGIILSMYGGGFATVPAYLADIFGTQFVGAIHGRLLTAWSTAGIVGPVVVNYIREAQINAGVPRAQVYDRTMYILAGMLVLGFLANLLVRPWRQMVHEGCGSRGPCRPRPPAPSAGVPTEAPSASARAGWMARPRLPGPSSASRWPGASGSRWRAFSLRMANTCDLRLQRLYVHSLVIMLILPMGIMSYHGASNRHPSAQTMPTDRFIREETYMKDIVVIGAGKIGSTIADMLAHSGDYRVTVADRSPRPQLAAVERTMPSRRCGRHRRPARHAVPSFRQVRRAQRRPYHLTSDRRSRSLAGVHYLDLTEDVESTRQVKESRKAPIPPSFRNAALRRASSRSSPTISPAASTRSTASACASAPCRNIRPTRSTTT